MRRLAYNKADMCRLEALTNVRLEYVSIESFPEAPNLRDLSLVGISLSPAELNALSTTSTSLTLLSMNGCHFEEDDAQTQLEPATTLQ